MKKKLNILGWILLAVVVSSCSDFLEESSQDEIRPGTVNDLEQLLLGEGYLRSDYIANYLDLLTDDIESNYTESFSHKELLPNGASAFSWSKDMYERLTERMVLGADTWESLYAKIKGCNVVLDMLDKVDGSEKDKLNQRGQALALRSFYYFMLVNLYGQPYNAAGVDITRSPGVPLILESAVKDDFPPRASVAEVYEQIERDLLEAAPLMEKYGQNNYVTKVTDLFVHTLLSRIYLYMENWEKAAEHAGYVIERKPMLVNLSGHFIIDEFWGESVFDMQNGAVYNLNSVELIWGYSGGSEYMNYFAAADFDFGTYTALPIAYQSSSSLIGLYDSEDLRSTVYYVQYQAGWVTLPNYGQKFNSEGTGNPAKGMRVAELYLNRAEANIQLFLKTGNVQLRDAALKDLNYLRSHRYTQPYTDVTIEEIPDLLQFCREERRRELSFEDHRWFDLRRYGMPELKHTLTLIDGQPIEYVLPAGGDRYVLPIAKVVLDRNPALVQNP